jgi:hypothetical protein
MLVTSRPINCTEIVEYPAAERFIKLPIENYLKLMPAPLPLPGSVFDNLNRPQIALINAINSPDYRFIVAALSRRLGKTFMANIIGQLVTLIPGCNVLVISPNYTLSSISFDLQRTFIRHFDLEVLKDNLKDKIIELSNGSTIRMGSLSTVDSSVGRSYQLIIFDEAALGADGENAFNISLRPTLDTPNSKAIFISTPRGKKNWFSKFFRRGFEAEYPAWFSIHADYTENSRMTLEDVNEAKASMTKDEFEQEYMASFTSFLGQIYKFDHENVVDYDATDGAEAIAGLDPGYKDPTAFLVIMHKEGVFHVVDEYLESQVTTAEHAESMQRLIDKWGIDPIFIDSAAAQFASDLAYIYNIASIKAKKEVLEGIALVQTIIEQDRLKVSPHCVHTLDMLDQYRWDDKPTLIKEKPLHDKYSHIADALRYALYTLVI